MFNPEIVSKFKNANKILYLLGILLFTFLSYLSFTKFNGNDFKTYGNLAGVICFISFLIWIIYYVISIPKIYVYSSKIEIHKFLGTYKLTILFNEINSWVIREKESKQGNYENLYLVINENEIYKISSFEYSNFYEIKSKIVKNKPKNNNLKNKLEQQDNLKFSIIFTLLGVIFIYLATQFYQDTSLTLKDVWVIKGNLSEDIRLERGRRSKSLVFKLENLNDFEFKIGSLALKETFYEDLMKDLKRGDEIYLTIEKEEYQKKISKKTQMTFLDKYFHYEKIDVVSVESKNFSYLTLSDFNKTHKNNDYWGIGFFGIFGLFFISFGIIFYIKMPVNNNLAKL